MSSLPVVVTAGGTRIDYLITRQGVARLGLLGGNALYSAVGAALWTDRVGIWSKVGSNLPRSWLADAADLGICTTGVRSVVGRQEHRTFYAYTDSGHRDDTNPAYHFTAVGQALPPELVGYVNSTPGQDDPASYEPMALRPEDWPLAYDGCQAVHLGPIAIRTHVEVPRLLRARGVPLITVDPGERYMRPEMAAHIRAFLPEIDAFLPSLMEVRSLFGDAVAPETAARRLLDWGARVVVVKAGEAGVYIFEASSNLEAHLPAYHARNDTRVVDVTGAGDSFCGGFLAGLQSTGDVAQAALRGLVSASLVIEGYGALYALAERLQDAAFRLHELQERSGE